MSIGIYVIYGKFYLLTVYVHDYTYVSAIIAIIITSIYNGSLSVTRTESTKLLCQTFPYG
jgi:hypothetical protein